MERRGLTKHKSWSGAILVRAHLCIVSVAFFVVSGDAAVCRLQELVFVFVLLFVQSCEDTGGQAFSPAVNGCSKRCRALGDTKAVQQLPPNFTASAHAPPTL